MKRFSGLILALAGAILGLHGITYALSSGPAMPEYNDFESIDNTDLVNLATGDMAYTIPVMTVPGPGLGFPLVLNYHSGIQPEQEASWVGLGWNLEAGAITRQINNVPDDFKGTPIDEVLTSDHMHGWMASIAWNGATVGISWDSEVGLGGMIGYSYGIQGTPLAVGGTAGVNGVYDGIGVSIGFTGGSRIGDNASIGAGMSIGVHSKRGVTAGLHAGVNLTSEVGTGADAIQTSASLASVGVSLASTHGQSAGASAGVGFASSASVAGNVQSSSSNVWIPVWTPWTGYMELNFGTWDTFIDGFQEDLYYGFLYSTVDGMDCSQDPKSCYTAAGTHYTRCRSCNTKPRLKKMDYNNPVDYLRVPSGTTYPTPDPDVQQAYFKMGYTGEDIYSVQTQGISGTFRPYRAEDGDYYSYVSNQDYQYQTGCEMIAGYVAGNCDRSGTFEFGPQYEGGGAGLPQRNRHAGGSLVWRFNEEAGGALYTNPFTRDAGPVVSAASKRIEPIMGVNSIDGWLITKPDGTRYLYGNPQYNYVQQTIGSSTNDMAKSTKREMPSYAYAWPLIAILSPDYVAIGDNQGRNCVSANQFCGPRDGDLGGWIRFAYTPRKLVGWKTPVDRSSDAGGFKPNMTVENWSAAMGYKSISYLDSVITPSHVAIMDRADESRQDAIPPHLGEIGFPVNDIVQDQDPVPSLPPDVCSDTKPHFLDKHNYTIVVNGADETLPPGTEITLVARRKFQWTKFECKWSWSSLSMTCTDFCKSGSQDQIVDHLQLPQPVNGKYLLHVSSSTEIESARLVIGKIEKLNQAARLAFLKGITLKSRAFGETGTEVGAARFFYDYSLAQKTPNSESSKAGGDAGDQGRLTLRAVQTGGGSKGPWTPPYAFKYYSTTDDGGKEIPYDRRFKDNWGYYCGRCNAGRQRPDGSANVWNLKSIVNPSGAKLEFVYEPKTAEYVEGIPAVIEGSKLADFFTIQNEYPSADGNDLRNWRFQNLDFIYKPIADYVQGKYMVYLGRFEGRANSSDETDKYDMGPVQNHPAIADALAKDPTLTVEYLMEGVVNGPPAASFTCGFLDPSRNGTLNYVDNLGSAPVIVGQIKGGAFTAGTISRMFPLRPWKDRVWAIFNHKPDFRNYQGGVRVSQVRFMEPFIGKTNVVSYEYRDAATPTLPESFSNYESSLKYRPETGVKAYLGSPAILHGQVTAEYRIDDAHEYKTEYRFVTSKDLPVKLIPKKIPNYVPGDELQAKLKILDRSGLWGSLWRKTDSSASGKNVRQATTSWTARIPSDLKSDFNLGGQDLGLTLEGSAVLTENAAKTSVRAPGDAEQKYFGVTQKLWSNRFIPAPCDEVLAQNKSTCLSGQKGAHTAQFEIARFTPLQRYQYSIQDGVRSQSETNYFDFLTGDPLLEISKNRTAQGQDEFIATLTSKAYHQSGTAYGLMKDRNMLAQPFSKTTFKFTSDPNDKIPGELSEIDLGQVATSEVTAWGDFWHEPTATHRFRQDRTYTLRDRAGFQLPTPATDFSAKWFSAGTVERYDEFGHTLQFRGPTGTRAAQIIGYRNSLPTAFTQNAEYAETYYQSFETDEFRNGMVVGYSSASALSSKRSRTGKSSLRIVNCKEADGKCPTGDQGTFACFDLPQLPINRTYVASAWYYDEYKGSNPDNPLDESYLLKPIKVTRPGLFIGDQDGGAGCHEEIHPNGVQVPSNPEFVPPLGNSDVRAGQRAMGDRNWKRISVEFSPGAGCGTNGLMSKAWICLYASKGKAGSDVYYDEVRVRPKGSLMTTYAYDARGKIVSSADANETTTHYEYDAFGNLTGIRNDDGKLISEQAKRHAQPNVNYSLHRGGVYDFNDLPADGCENFDVMSSPPGYDVAFSNPQIEPAGAATFKLKKDAQGNEQPSLCYQTYQPFTLTLTMRYSGTAQAFAIGARNPVSYDINECSMDGGRVSLSDLKPADEGKCKVLLDHGTTNMPSTLHLDQAYLGLILPTEAELRAQGRIPALAQLQSYKITISVPAEIEKGDLGSTSSNFPYHARFNFFDDVGSNFTFQGDQQANRTKNLDYVMVPGNYASYGKAFSLEYVRPALMPFTGQQLGPISKSGNGITAPNFFAFSLYGDFNPVGSGLWPMDLSNSELSPRFKNFKFTITPVTTTP